MVFMEYGLYIDVNNLVDITSCATCMCIFPKRGPPSLMGAPLPSSVLLLRTHGFVAPRSFTPRLLRQSLYICLKLCIYMIIEHNEMKNKKEN